MRPEDAGEKLLEKYKAAKATREVQLGAEPVPEAKLGLSIEELVAEARNLATAVLSHSTHGIEAAVGRALTLDRKLKAAGL